MSWIVTLPVTALVSAGLFSFAYYSPNKLNERDYLNNYNTSGDYYDSIEL